LEYGCDIAADLPTHPTTIHLRFYLYMTTNWSGTWTNGASWMHWIFTNSGYSSTAFRINMATNREIGECTSGNLCVVPEGDGGEQWWSTAASCTGGGYWGTTYINTVNLKDYIGQWVAMEYRMQISGSNVILTEWVNGTQTRGPCTGPGSDVGYFHKVIFSGWENTGYAHDADYYIDDIVIADSYIGPMGGGDITAPTVTITSPTSSDTYSASTTPLTLGGTASDNVAVSSIAYSNNGAAYSACSGTTSWTCSNISLTSGSNVISVRATDSSSNTATDTITVTYTPPAPTISSVNSDKTNGTYGTGEVIDIDVYFSEAVTSTAAVTVTLDTGGTCQFTVTGQTMGTCNYTVASGQNSSDLTTTSISVASGQYIRNAGGTAMTNFTPTTNLAANKALVISTTVPVMSGTYPSANQNCTPHRNPVTMGLTTNIAATCRYSTLNVPYASMTLTLDGAGTTTHSKSITPTCDYNHHYYIQCSASGNATTTPAEVSFYVTPQWWIRKHDVEIR
jgi:hypothetical protein